MSNRHSEGGVRVRFQRDDLGAFERCEPIERIRGDLVIAAELWEEYEAAKKRLEQLHARINSEGVEV